MRRVSQTDARTKVVLVRLLLKRKGIREHCARDSKAKRALYGREGKKILRGIEILVSQSECRREIRTDAPGILHIGRQCVDIRFQQRIPEDDLSASGDSGKI